jgi:hypothetical protein
MRTAIRRAILAVATGVVMMTMVPAADAVAAPTTGARPAQSSPGTPDKWCEPRNGSWFHGIGTTTLDYVQTAHENKDGYVVRARYYNYSFTMPPLQPAEQPQTSGPFRVRHECGKIRANEHNSRAPRR